MTLNIDTTQQNLIIVQLRETETIIDTIEKENIIGSQALLTAIETLLATNNVYISEINEITVNPKAGSYTGTRVGVAVANALAYANNITVNGVRPPKQIAEPTYTS